MVGRLYFGGAALRQNGGSGSVITPSNQDSAVKRQVQGLLSDDVVAPRNGAGGQRKQKQVGNYNRNNGEGGSDRNKKGGGSQIPAATSSIGDETNEDEEEDEEIIRDIEEGILDVFSDAYCNKHFVYAVLELVLVRVMPELAEKGVGELWGERVS